MKRATPQQDTIIQRYEWIDDSNVIGFVDYYVFDEVCMIMHTEVLPTLAGRGLGSHLAGKALEHVSEIGKSVVPICGFIVHYLRKNSQHHALLTPESRRIFNIGT
ncbi:GNAT family N-acetyltransferase [Herminiimonas aquatilis]|uniref:GNAT family N-acetyltransferase n=1 Tax=Herminiimonas aquatilis TaxID=345342 RepID=A0ABW2JA82_9BURK